MFQSIYEIRVCGRDVKIDRETWDNIREHVRGFKAFFVILNGEKYKYVNDQVFYDRPTRFDFTVMSPEDETIDYIYVTEIQEVTD